MSLIDRVFRTIERNGPGRVSDKTTDGRPYPLDGDSKLVLLAVAYHQTRQPVETIMRPAGATVADLCRLCGMTPDRVRKRVALLVKLGYLTNLPTIGRKRRVKINVMEIEP